MAVFDRLKFDPEIMVRLKEIKRFDKYVGEHIMQP